MNHGPGNKMDAQMKGNWTQRKLYLLIFWRQKHTNICHSGQQYNSSSTSFNQKMCFYTSLKMWNRTTVQQKKVKDLTARFACIDLLVSRQPQLTCRDLKVANNTFSDTSLRINYISSLMRLSKQGKLRVVCQTATFMSVWFLSVFLSKLHIMNVLKHTQVII